LRCACLVLFAVVTAAGQEVNASLTGTVVDPTGAVIPNARVVLSGLIDSETRTNKQGEFAIRGLRPGSYTLKLKSPGFRTRSRRVSLQEGQTKSLGMISLEIGPVACDGEWIPGQVTQERIAEDAAPRLSGFVQGVYNVPNVFVVVRKAGTSEVMAVAHADEGGEFEFPSLSPGTYEVEVSHNGTTHLGARSLSLRKGFEVELTMGWGTGNCITAR
jgi:hypothetical protein